MWHEVRKLLPEESIVYLADGKNCPYGERHSEDIAHLTRQAVVELLARGVKMVVVACNTATAVAIDALRAEFDIPFVGMEPAVKPAALATKSGTIGILATRASLHGDLFRTTSAKYAHDVRVLEAVGEGFVEAVEEGREHNAETLEMVRKVLEPIIAEGADQIVLGCTHYPFLEGAIRDVIGDREVAIVNPAPAVARRVEWILDNGGLRADEGHKSEYSFVTFGGDNYLARITDKAMQVVQQEE